MTNTLPCPKTIYEWQEMFDHIYGKKNEALDVKDILCHLIEEAGEVAKDMRLEDYSRLDTDIPDIFAWLCSFASKQAIDLEEEVWKKYPRICPYCGKSIACVCISEGSKEKKSNLLTDKQKNNSKPTSFQEWDEMFHKIYGNVNRVLSHSAVGYHLMEEIGELARSIRDETKKDYREEVADVFAWLVAVTMKRARSNGRPVRLDEMTFKSYPGHCKHCHERVCECDNLKDGPRY